MNAEIRRVLEAVHGAEGAIAILDVEGESFAVRLGDEARKLAETILAAAPPTGWLVGLDVGIALVDAATAAEILGPGPKAQTGGNRRAE